LPELQPPRHFLAVGTVGTNRGPENPTYRLPPARSVIDAIFTTLAGRYLLNKSLLKHFCDVCKQFAKDDAALDNSNLFLHFKAYNTDNNLFGNLKTASEMFYGYVYTLETRFFENIE
jgi:hypothetical protein